MWLKGIEIGEGPAIPESPSIPIYIKVLTHELKANLPVEITS